MVYLGYIEYCKKCGGSDANCSEYTKQPHYVINATKSLHTRGQE